MKARGKRSQTIVVTKVGSPMGPGKKGLKAKYIEEAAEASLRRLQVETIDLYLSHWPDPEAPHEETLGAYAKLIAAGKIRWCGASNYNAERCAPRSTPRRREAYRATRCCSPSTISTIVVPTTGRCAISASRGDRRHHLFQPRQRVPDRQISQRGRSRAEPPRGAVEAYLNPRGSRILAALDEIAAGHKAAPAEVALRLANSAPGRHRANRERDLADPTRKPDPRDRAHARRRRSRGAGRGERALAFKPGRHCEERSEAIRAAAPNSGLLRCARNGGEREGT